MSFLFETINIPFWFIVFILASATPLWIKWYKMGYKKFRSYKSDEELKSEVLQKATDHWNTNSEFSGFADSEVPKKKKIKKDVDPVKKQNIRATLKVLAECGETGVLPKSISDKTDIAVLDVNVALQYLLEKKYAEVLNGSSGMKYYLTPLGKKYCTNKNYI